MHYSSQAEEYSRRLDISVKTMEKSRQLDDYFLNSIANIPRPDSVGMFCSLLKSNIVMVTLQLQTLTLMIM